MTTVGYGDFFPTTVAGRFVGIMVYYVGERSPSVPIDPDPYIH
jgi:hypothetical protein